VLRADVLVVGAGPAGSVAALNLAPTHRVVLVERSGTDRRREGESLPPAAGRLLADMGLLASFMSGPHLACLGHRSAWGAPDIAEIDFLRDPDGHGWHIDRSHFDSWLRSVAVERGAHLLRPAEVVDFARQGDAWSGEAQTCDGRVAIEARVLIDASGRRASLARRLGAQRQHDDRLVCGWIGGRAQDGPASAGFSIVEAVEEGWWYTAPIPGGRRIVAFHTDADLAAAEVARAADGLRERATALTHLSAVLSQCGFVEDGAAGFTAAHGAALSPCSGEGWLAVGDAVLAFDPLAAQGLFNALYTGLAGAAAVAGYCGGDGRAFTDYAAAVGRIRRHYESSRLLWYGLEHRWSDAPFWQRRHTPGVGRQATVSGTRLAGECPTGP
jgi:flavin-dependent dehydrogenase